MDQIIEENLEKEFACLIQKEAKEEKKSVEYNPKNSLELEKDKPQKIVEETLKPEENQLKTNLDPKPETQDPTIQSQNPELPEGLLPENQPKKMKKLKKIAQVREEKAQDRQKKFAEEEARRKEINKKFGHILFEREAEEGEENEENGEFKPTKQTKNPEDKDQEDEDQDRDLEELIDRSFDGDREDYDQDEADRQFIQDMADDSEKIMDFLKRQELRAKELQDGHELLKEDRNNRINVIQQLMQQIQNNNSNSDFIF